jgi:exopolysaccharide production protein ExoZ
LWPSAAGIRPDNETVRVKFLSLQALRALAAIVVVVYHAQGLCHKYATGPSLTEKVLQDFGRYGVDLFFVLSGFVILYAIHKTNSTPGAFLARRLIRIVPIYWVLTLGLIALSVLVPAAFSAHGPLEPRIVVQSMLFVSYALNSQQPMLYVGWSVEYEMFFYVLVALALMAALPLYRGLGLIFLGSYAALHLFVPAAGLSGNVWFFLGSPLLFEFEFGLFLAELASNTKLRALDVAIPLVAVGLTLAIDASYSIYLVQVMALPAVGKLVARVIPDLPPDLLILSAVVLVVLAGTLLYRTIERPLLKMVQAAVVPAPAATIAPA